MPEAFSILIPTYNERENIEPLLTRIVAALPGRDYEVLFVDDDSKDGTAELINRLSAKYPARVEVRKNKKGLASAVIDGFGWAKHDTILVMDADLQHPPEVIPSVITAIDEGADIAVASRRVPGGGTNGWSTFRKITSDGAIMLAHLFLPSSRRVKDPMSGFFAFRRRVIEGVTLAPIGYKILLEMLVTGKAKNVREVPFMFVPREKGKSKLSIKQEIEYAQHLLSLMRRNGVITHFFKFCLVGASGVIVNNGMLWLLHDQGKANWDIRLALLIAIEISIVSNYLLNNYFTFADRHKPGLKHFLANFLRFNLFSLPGAALNWVTTVMLTNTGNLSYLVFNMVGIAAAMMWNFFANSRWTWKKLNTGD
ncbi:MAG: glycosyltransferase family 2 protein [Dehalococcoidia bacterium]|nr:glycosyltransferase family 2 protein [Dehalococcoidia bacterium]